MTRHTSGTSRRTFLGGLATAALVTGLGAATTGTAHAAEQLPRQRARQQVQQQGVKVMPLGDSITDGFNVPGGYRIDLWNSLVADGYSIDFVGSLQNGPDSLGDKDHEGHSGWTIGQIQQNINGWLATYTPQTILLHIGTNDMWGDAGSAAQQLATLVNTITTQAPDTHLFVATIVPFPMNEGTVQAFNAEIPGIVQAAGGNVHLVDQYNALTASDLADGIHPNAVGYSKMAATWYEALLSVPGSIGNTAAAPARA